MRKLITLCLVCSLMLLAGTALAERVNGTADQSAGDLLVGTWIMDLSEYNLQNKCKIRYILQADGQCTATITYRILWGSLDETVTGTWYATANPGSSEGELVLITNGEITRVPYELSGDELTMSNGGYSFRLTREVEWSDVEWSEEESLFPIDPALVGTWVADISTVLDSTATGCTGWTFMVDGTFVRFDNYEYMGTVYDGEQTGLWWIDATSQSSESAQLSLYVDGSELEARYTIQQNTLII